METMARATESGTMTRKNSDDDDDNHDFNNCGSDDKKENGKGIQVFCIRLTAFLPDTVLLFASSRTHADI